MVSSVLQMDEEELLALLQRLRQEYTNDPEFTALRAQLPTEWPI